MIRSRHSLAYPQAQALAENKPVPVIENPYKNPNSPYEYTGSAVCEKDVEWLRHDVTILMKSECDVMSDDCDVMSDDCDVNTV